jgi:hypothetical protein
MKKNLHEHRATYAYVIATIIFTAIVYVLLISTTNDLRENCNTINQERIATQKANIGTNDIVNVLEYYMNARLDGNRSKIAEGADVVISTIETLEDFEIETNIKLVNCKKQFPMPFPLSGL